MKSKRTRRTALALLVLLVLCLGAERALALPVQYYKECLADFTQKQRDWWSVDRTTENITWNFCGPTSAANSLLWMSYQYNLPKLRQWLDGDEFESDSDMIENIADIYLGFDKKWDDYGPYWDQPGTDASFVAGKRTYLDMRYPWLLQKEMDSDFTINESGMITGVSGTPPTIDWIKQELYKCEDVEIGFTFIKQVGDDYKAVGGHWMTFAGWDANQLIAHDPVRDVNEAGKIWKDYPGTAFDHWAYPDHYELDAWTYGGKTFITLPGYNPGYITVMDIAVSESVPEPCALLLLGTGIAAVAGVKRRRRPAT